MATLSADTLISSLSPASGETIDLAGHSLIVDADAASTPVKIANTGTVANLELRNGGRIKLNAAGTSGGVNYALPSNVRPYVDPANPLPASNFTAGFAGQAAAEIDLNGAMVLGGALASLPTETRSGSFQSRVAAWEDSTHVRFDRDMGLVAGDVIWNVMPYDFISSTVTAYDSASFTATLAAAPSRRTVGDVFVSQAVSIAIVPMNQIAAGIISADMEAGSLGILGSLGYHAWAATSAAVYADRLIALAAPTCDGGTGWATLGGGSVTANELFVPILAKRAYDKTETISATSFAQSGCEGGLSPTKQIGPSRIHLRGGTFTQIVYFPVDGVGLDFTFENCVFPSIPTPTRRQSAFRFKDCTFDVVATGEFWNELAGTVTRATVTEGGLTVEAWYHAPATAGDTTWRYTDRTVRAGETLRIAARWKAGDASAVARVAICDPANWFAGTNGGALAAHAFDGGDTAAWDSARVEWYNGTGEDAAVRVWECVTGSTEGGYLVANKVTGGRI